MSLLLNYKDLMIVIDEFSIWNETRVRIKCKMTIWFSGCLNISIFVCFLQTGSNTRHIPATQIFYDPASRRLTMHIRMEKEGSFQATVTYGDVKLKNGEFNILVLSCEFYFHFLFCVIFENCFCLTHFKFVESQKQIFAQNNKNAIFLSMPFVPLCLYHQLLKLSDFQNHASIIY